MTSSEVRPGCSGIYPVNSNMNGDGITSQHHLLLLTAFMGGKVFFVSPLNSSCINLFLLPLSLPSLIMAPSPYWHPCRSWGLLPCPSRATSSPDWASSSPKASLHGTNGPATIILNAHAELIRVYSCFLYWRPKAGYYYSCDLRNAGSSPVYTVLDDVSHLWHLLLRCTAGSWVAHAWFWTHQHRRSARACCHPRDFCGLDNISTRR